MTAHPQEVHGEEGQVEEHKGEPEVNLPKPFVHHAAEYLGNPKIEPGEHAKNDPGHNVVNVRHDVIRIVDKDIHWRRSHKNAAQATNREQGHKTQGKQHGRGEGNLATPQCP